MRRYHGAAHEEHPRVGKEEPDGPCLLDVVDRGEYFHVPRRQDSRKPRYRVRQGPRAHLGHDLFIAAPLARAGGPEVDTP